MLTGRLSSDADIVERTLAGNRTAFEILLERYSRMAYAVAVARTGNHEDAEDMVQEAWIQAFQNLPQLKQPEKFRPWFGAIVRNLSVNAAKKRWRERSFHEPRGDTASDVRQQIEDADEYAALWSQVDSLVPGHREALTLYYHAGMTTEEIAEAIGESREAVKKRLQRARAVLSDQAIRTVFEPAERDEKRRCKRTMAMLLAFPVKWDGPPDPHTSLHEVRNKKYIRTSCIYWGGILMKPKQPFLFH